MSRHCATGLFYDIRALMQVMGAVEAERFIALINRERFDYTEWRKNQWQDETVESLATRARTLREVDRT